MSAYLEFISENSQRRYPLVEDSQPVADDFQLPDMLVVDLAGYSLVLFTSIRLLKFSGSDSGASAPYEPVDGRSTLFFRLQVTSVLYFDIPVPLVDESPGARNTGTLVFGTETPSVVAALVVTMGGFKRWVDGDWVYGLPSDGAYDFGLTAPVESGLVFDLSGSQVNMLEVIRQDAADYSVSGAVRLRGGYNMDVSQIGNTLSLFPQLGAGELGRYESTPESLPCAELASSISGARPNDKGEFFILGGPGIVIEDSPSTYTITITATLPKPTKPGCATDGSPLTNCPP